ncbi:MAG: ribosomal RNA small subunit methyltransferase B [Candidatus Poribacteria bacterium]|nr:MAG: ribosomal RNA small subunit methyltransferase B [Candidatus Poribacteria bacterium]
MKLRATEDRGLRVREIAYRAIERWEHHPESDLKLILDEALREETLSPAERGFVTELVYGVVRWRRRLDAILDAHADRPRRIRENARRVLRMGVYQLLFMEAVPDYAAVHQSVELARRVNATPSGFINAVLRSVQRKGDIVRYPHPQSRPVAYCAVYYSYPEWILNRWLRQYGREAMEQLCQVHNTPAPLTLRVNALRTTREEMLAELSSSGAEVRPGTLSPAAILADNLPAIEELEPFQEGKLIVQDESSQLIGFLLDPRPGELVVDLCAAPGGKSTHLAELMNDEGRVVAVDISPFGLERLEENVRRLGLRSIEPRLGDARTLLPDLVGRADRVLVDAPCSSLGILRRHADARWQKTEGAIPELARVQREILSAAAHYVRPGGVLVYGVCTDTPEETVEVVQGFLAERDDFRPEPVKTILSTLPDDATTSEGALLLLPHRHGTDGFFAVRLRREGKSLKPLEGKEGSDEPSA